MLPARSLTDLSHALSADHILDAARTIESWRRPSHEQALARWFGFEVPGAWTTPYMLRAGLAAAAHGVAAFDRLERIILPPHPSWIHPEIGASGYGAVAGPETLHAPPLWPFAQDVPSADFQTRNLPPKWLSHSLVHTLVGFGHWPGLTEWELMGMARLSEAMASFHWYWLSELGRLDLEGMRLDLSNLGATDTAHYLYLEQQAKDPGQRRARLDDEASRHIADNALQILNYETYAFRQLIHEGDLIEPNDAYINFGEAAEYAKTHHHRLMSPAFSRFLEHAMVAGTDYATSPDQFETRAAHALAAVMDESECSAFDTRARAIRTLQDTIQRLCHADFLTPHPETASALRLLADTLGSLRSGAPEALAATALSEAMSRLGVVATAPVFFAATTYQPAAFALGYTPVSDLEDEPAPLRDLRALALVRRGYALHPTIGASMEGMMPLVRRCLAQPVRSGSLVDQLMAVAEESTQREEIPMLGYAYVGWLQLVVGSWGSSDPASSSHRWHYRLARRHLPEDASTFGEYEVAWNPYLKRYPLPFDSRWNDELGRTRPGQAKVFRGKNTASVWYALIGPGRERGVYLPLVPRLNSLVFYMKKPRRLNELVDHPDYGLDFMRQAIADEAVLLFHKPRIDRPERAIDIYEVAMEASAGLDHGLEPYGPWDEEGQAEAYLRFCETSGHYRESSEALCDVAQISPSSRVAELGFGTGETTRVILARLRPEGRYLGVDPAPRMLNLMLGTNTDDRARFQLGGARALAWTAAYEGGFDRIIASASLWLSADIGDALTNLWRATAPGGRLAISIPAEYLGFIEHMQTDDAVQVQVAIQEARTALAIAPPAVDPSFTQGALGDVERFRAALMDAGYSDVEFSRWSRPWPASELIDWLAMPVVAEGLCGPNDKERAPELIEAVRARVNPASPLLAVWYLVVATRPAQ